MWPAFFKYPVWTGAWNTQGGARYYCCFHAGRQLGPVCVFILGEPFFPPCNYTPKCTEINIVRRPGDHHLPKQPAEEKTNGCWVWLLVIILLWIHFTSLLTFFFLATLQGLWDLSSPTRNRTHILCTGRQSLNLWTPREVPLLVDLRDICLCFTFSFHFQVESPVRGWFPKGASQESYSGGRGEFLEGWKTDVHFMYTCTTHNRYLSRCLGFSQRASSPWVHVYVCDSIQNHT